MNYELRIRNIRKKVKCIIHDSLFMIRSRGFTLIELLVAMSIIGIFSSLLLANFVGVRQRTRDGVRKADLRQIQSALELFRSDQAAYPASIPACGSSLVLGRTVYMRKIPCDPSTATSYTYSSPSGNTTYSIFACLENGNDAQIDMPKTNCQSATTWKYTLQNP